MKRMWVVRAGVAAMAAGMWMMGMTAGGQVVSPPPNPQLPPPAPLAGVRYDYPWEIYGGFAYSHFDAGPNLLQGANLGGFDARVVRELGTRWGVGANVRGYYGTSGVAPTAEAARAAGRTRGRSRDPM